MRKCKGITVDVLVGENLDERRKIWAWEEAGCAFVQDRRSWLNIKGEVTSTTMYTLDSVTRGEPDPKLFAVDPAYVEQAAEVTEHNIDIAKYGPNLETAPQCIKNRFAKEDWNWLYKKYGVGSTAASVK